MLDQDIHVHINVQIDLLSLLLSQCPIINLIFKIKCFQGLFVRDYRKIQVKVEMCT